MDEFEKLLEAERISVERFVRFRIYSKYDADDLMQEIFLTACKKFRGLKNRASFKAWIISIARNKCNDYFRKKARQCEILTAKMTEHQISDSRHGVIIFYNPFVSSNLYTVRVSCGVFGIPMIPAAPESLAD